MRNTIAGLLLASTLCITAAASAAPAGDPSAGLNCKTATVQTELDACADRDFDLQDKKLNAVYRALMQKSEAADQTLLKAAERNWLAYRDSECAYETSDSNGGSIHPMDVSICLTEKTKARTAELNHAGN
jgi:uncharacterized protein YecT (DUF1311 family)